MRHGRTVGGAANGKLLFGLCLAAVAVIVALDFVTYAGVVVGILLTVPIVAMSRSPRPSRLYIVVAAAIVGYILQAIWGRGPVTPAAFWVPNRIIAFTSVVASGALAIWIQRQRLNLERTKDEALAAGELNRLLHALFAHDLRAPLALAKQALDYVSNSVQGGRAVVDVELLADVSARLGRNLQGTADILDLARESASAGGAAPPQRQRAVPVVSELTAQLRTFAPEAAARGKRLRLEVEPGGEGEWLVDPAVLRQVTGTLVDNAIRHAHPGEVRVSAYVADGWLCVSVEDEGPGLSATRSRGAAADHGGSGVGLELSRLLARRAGGRVEVAKDDTTGSRLCLWLPVRQSPPPG